MAWLNTLARTYDVYANLAGVEKNGYLLLPISHSTFKAQIELTIDADGNFIDAKKLEKGDDAVTIIPVTEDSAARTSDKAPHPLCDKLCYIAGDYTLYTGDNKEEYFEAYIGQLREWSQSDTAHPMVKSICQYVAKKTLIHDLVESNVLQLDEHGRLTDSTKIHGFGQTGANVRFIVFGSIRPREVWKNQQLYQNFNDFYQQKLPEKKLCYATGEIRTYLDKHPAKIRNSADKAKLISGNDTDGFTYRGRFTSKEQAVSVGYNTSQKAHNALRWLIQKQGYTRDGAAIVSWMVNRDMKVIDFTKDSVNACRGLDEFDFDNFDLEETSSARRHDTGKYFAEQLNRAVNGYAAKIKVDDRIAVMALDSTVENKGRLSVVYYDEMGAKQYMDAILNWQNHCRWRRSIKIENTGDVKKRITLECTPSPRDIALAALGVQRSEWLEADSKVVRATVKRLLPCVTQKGVKIPYDLIKAAANRASMPQTMSDFVWYHDVLCVVCAMIRYDYEEDGRKMENFLNDKMDDRNVLFGRLLAVYDYMERRAMYEKDENGNRKESRTTNAKRYWNAFSSRPAKTAKTIQQNMIAYEKKLNDFEQMKFENWEREIMIRLANNGFDNTALSEFYLPGYYLQMEEMKQVFQKKEQ